MRLIDIFDMIPSPFDELVAYLMGAGVGVAIAYVIICGAHTLLGLPC